MTSIEQIGIYIKRTFYVEFTYYPLVTCTIRTKLVFVSFQLNCPILPGDTDTLYNIFVDQLNLSTKTG